MSGTTLAGEDPSVTDVAEALASDTPAARAEALVEEGIGVVLVDLDAPGEVAEIEGEVVFAGPRLEVLAIADAEPPAVPSVWYPAMTAAWLGFVAGPLVAIALASRRRAARLPRT